MSQGSLNFRCERVRATEHALSDPCRLLERRDALADIVERGGGVLDERLIETYNTRAWSGNTPVS